MTRQTQALLNSWQSSVQDYRSMAAGESDIIRRARYLAKAEELSTCIADLKISQQEFGAPWTN